MPFAFVDGICRDLLQMIRILKAVVACGVLVVPVVVTELTDSFWKWHAVGILTLLGFFGYYYVHKPDLRFEKVRTATLDALFNVRFKTWINQLHANERLPFRVNVMQRRGCLRPRLVNGT
jgi:hypothetical protein